jgi:hypothetical protein
MVGVEVAVGEAAVGGPPGELPLPRPPDDPDEPPDDGGGP